MLLFPVTAAAALVPSLLLMAYFHARDLYREPPAVLWKVFGLGVATLVPVVLVAWPVRLALAGVDSPLLWGLATAFLEAAVPEELLKFAVVWLYALRRPEFDEPFDGVVYGVAASLGFATLENVLYVTGTGLGVAVLRAFTAVPAHAFLGALMGYFAGRARLAGEGRRRLLVLALAVPTLLHGLYDFPILALERASEGGAQPEAPLVALAALVPAIVLAEWIWAVRIVRRLRSDQERLAALAAPADSAALPPSTPPATPAGGPPRATHGAPAAWPAATHAVGPGAAATLPGRASSAAMVLGGGAAVCAGALMGLAVAVAVATGEVPREDLVWAVAAVVVFAGAPVTAGGALFAWGIHRLNRRGRALRSATVLGTGGG